MTAGTAQSPLELVRDVVREHLRVIRRRMDLQAIDTDTVVMMHNDDEIPEDVIAELRVAA